ncbi:hypothetical protein JR316_0004619 [Psilocybe cubensis]|uniref:E3 ubiquitin-protein ligase RNF220 middle domain-containing protein n=2 Tax=Psilocybe cubensis TaxID=181762 RepID=A0A8H7XWB9_PSICU|nr:hypothetical protein JR316_0004619 [Psilocybe cubensis]KAH9482519.1 hypothetical protein JR316_0004619 [Psilocybe cubensis]
MALTITLKARGKRRIIESPSPELASLSSGSEPPHPTKRARRAETRPCPVCNEQIPLRLLPMHAQLESERVEEVVKRVGSLDVAYEDLVDEPGPSSRARRSAIKARKSMTTTRTHDSLDESTRTIQSVKRRRKRRNAKLKDMLKEEEEGHSSRTSWLRRFTGEEINCPVCNAVVRGDQDVIDAHVDACLAHESSRLEEARQREALHQSALDEENWNNPDDNGGYVGDIRGAGFYRRADDECVDEDIDIDGDDQAVFGEVQFTESDIVPVQRPQEDIDEDVDIEIEATDDVEPLASVQTSSQRQIPGQTDETASPRLDVTGMTELTKSELAVLSARQRRDKAALVVALENKIRLMVSHTITLALSFSELQNPSRRNPPLHRRVLCYAEFV